MLILSVDCKEDGCACRGAIVGVNKIGDKYTLYVDSTCSSESIEISEEVYSALAAAGVGRIGGADNDS